MKNVLVKGGSVSGGGYGREQRLLANAASRSHSVRNTSRTGIGNLEADANALRHDDFRSSAGREVVDEPLQD
jgi:hypothetical protein